MGKQIEISAGERFGRLEVISELNERSRGGHRLVLVKCDCQSVFAVRVSSLASGQTRSCGCLRREVTGETGKANHGENNGNWKGDDCGYIAAHQRIVNLKGNAKDHVCSEEGCGRRAYDWAYKHHWGYSTDPADYRALCRSCHKKLDIRAKRESV